MGWKNAETAWGIEIATGGLLKYTFHALHEAEEFLKTQTVPGLKVVEVKVVTMRKWKKMKRRRVKHADKG